MTDTAPTPPVDPGIQAELDRIHGEITAKAQAEAAAAQAEDDRIAALEAAKALCEERCGAIGQRMLATADPLELEALRAYQERTHAEHASQLEQAYLTFSGQRIGDSNPAGPGTTQVSSTIENQQVGQA